MVARYLVCWLLMAIINCSCVAMEQKNVLQEQAPEVIQMNTEKEGTPQEEVCSDRCMCCFCPVLWFLVNYDDTCNDVEIMS